MAGIIFAVSLGGGLKVQYPLASIQTCHEEAAHWIHTHTSPSDLHTLSAISFDKVALWFKTFTPSSGIMFPRQNWFFLSSCKFLKVTRMSILFCSVLKKYCFLFYYLRKQINMRIRKHELTEYKLNPLTWKKDQFTVAKFPFVTQVFINVFYGEKTNFGTKLLCQIKIYWQLKSFVQRTKA